MATPFSIQITGLHPALDGTYPLEINKFKNQDWRTLETMAGATPLTLTKKIGEGSISILTALAAVGLSRAGKEVPEMALWDTEAGGFKLVGNELDKEDALLPPESEPDAIVERSDDGSTSGGSSKTTGDLSQEPSPPNSSGTPSSEASA